MYKVLSSLLKISSASYLAKGTDVSNTKISANIYCSSHSSKDQYNSTSSEKEYRDFTRSPALCGFGLFMLSAFLFSFYTAYEKDKLLTKFEQCEDESFEELTVDALVNNCSLFV